MKKFTPRQYAELLYELVADAKKPEIAKRIHAFAQFLVRARATALVPRIEQAFEELWAEREGVMRVEVAAAHSLSATLRVQLTKALGAKKLEIEESIEPELLGGMRLKIQDTIIDGTIKAHLLNLKKTLAAS